jgi:hypothetical protein
MRSASSSNYLSRSEQKSEGIPRSATVRAAAKGLSDERSHEVLWKPPKAEEWRRAYRVIAAEFVSEICGYDVRRYFTEDAGPSTPRH